MNSGLTSQELPADEFANELKPGTKLLHGQYIIEQFLNCGGFGITYLAKDSLDRRVVIKECYPESICWRSNATVQVRSLADASAFRTMVELFIAEARNLARLTHPNIVGVHQVFEDNDTAYIAMDFVQGRDLLEIVESSKSFSPKELEKIVIKLLGAVELIHREGILHRDIAPDNILLGPDNEPVLIDFGAARETVTRATRILGAMRTVKDGYSPQEFYVNNADQFPSSDLYSLSASLYHVITHKIPPNAHERLAALASGEPDPCVSIKTLASGYPEPFLDCIDRALSVFPKDRIQSAAEWRAELTSARVLSLNGGSAYQPQSVAQEEKVVKAKDQTKAPAADTHPNEVTQSSGKVVPRRHKKAEPSKAAKVEDTNYGPEELVSRSMRETPRTSKSKFVGTAAAALLVFVGAGAYFFLGAGGPNETANDLVAASTVNEPVAKDVAVVDEIEPPAVIKIQSIPEPILLYIENSETVARNVSPVETLRLPEPPRAFEVETVDLGPVAVDPVTRGTTSAPEIVARPILTPEETIGDTGITLAALPNTSATGSGETALPSISPYGESDLDIAVTKPNEIVPDTSSVSVSKQLDAQPPRRSPTGVDAPLASLTPSISTKAPEPRSTEASASVIQDISSVISGKTFEFAVVADKNDPMIVISAEGPAANVLKPGYRILTTNGIPVASLNEVRRVVNSMSDYSVGDDVSVTLGIEDPFTGERFVRSVKLPAIQETLLLNGVRFQTGKEGDAWITTVANGTGPEPSDLQAGDRIVALMPSNELIDTRDGLAHVLRREIQKGATQFNFAVNRDSEMWFVTLRYSAVAGQ